MNIQLHFDEIRHSPWLDQFLEKRLERLEKFLRPEDRVKLILRGENNIFESRLCIQKVSKEIDFSARGDSLFESFSKVIDQAFRVLSENKKKKLKMRQAR